MNLNRQLLALSVALALTACAKPENHHTNNKSDIPAAETIAVLKNGTNTMAYIRKYTDTTNNVTCYTVALDSISCVKTE